MTGLPPIAALLAERRASRPDDLAITVEGGDDLAFAEWDRRSSAVARGLARRGTNVGDRVALRFDARHWAAYAVAYAGVLKAGAVAALIPAGLATVDADRIVRHAGAAGVLAPEHLADLPSAPWSADPGTVEQQDGPEPWRGALDESPVAEMAYPLAPFSRPRPVLRTHAEVAVPPGPARLGWLVHAWAPGTAAGQVALAHALAGADTGAATLARFSPEALAELVARLGATACGLTPGLAAAMATMDPLTPGDRASVSHVWLSPGRQLVRRTALLGLFPAAAVLDLGEGSPSSVPGDPRPAPAGASQLGMLWHEQLAPGSFNLPCLVRRFRGRLDVAALERALAEIVRRHEPLRTTFEVVEGTPRQVVGTEPVGLPVLDLTSLAPQAREAEVARIVGDASTQPFDLVDGPLFAARLVRLGADDHVLVVRLHHSAFDDWSVDVYRRELSALYTADVAGEGPLLAEASIRFVDVCREQQARQVGAAGDELRAWWRAQMAGAPFAVQLRLGEPAELGPDRPGAGEPLRHDLDPLVAKQVRALSVRLRATPFMTVLAAFEVLLARRTGQDDLVVASVVAGRSPSPVESMIGCFTRKVLLRLRTAGDPTFPDLVARTRATVLGALDHADLPFEAVVNDTLGRLATQHGLALQVPVVFQAEAPQRARLTLPDLSVGPFEVPATARREHHFSAGREPDDGALRPLWGDGAYLGAFLIMSLLEADGGLALVARGVFSGPAAQRLLDELELLLVDITQGPGRRLSELAAAAPGRRRIDAGDLDLAGLPLRRARLEAALSCCPGVASVAVAVARRDDDPRLAAYVVAEGSPPPGLAELRAALWTALPGSPWPAEAVLVDELPPTRDDQGLGGAPAPPPEPPDPSAALLAALWSACATGQVSPSTSYWQDFSFLQALAEARAAGLPITDEQVRRCRTPEMLAVALATAP